MLYHPQVFMTWRRRAASGSRQTLERLASPVCSYSSSPFKFQLSLPTLALFRFTLYSLSIQCCYINRDSIHDGTAKRDMVEQQVDPSRSITLNVRRTDIHEVVS